MNTNSPSDNQPVVTNIEASAKSTTSSSSAQECRVQRNKLACIEGLDAVRRLARENIGKYHGSAFFVRRFLLSLYGGAPVNLTCIGFVKARVHDDLAKVILGFGKAGFHDAKILEIFIEEGDREAKWFLDGLSKKASKYHS